MISAKRVTKTGVSVKALQRLQTIQDNVSRAKGMNRADFLDLLEDGCSGAGFFVARLSKQSALSVSLSNGDTVPTTGPPTQLLRIESRLGLSIDSLTGVCMMLHSDRTGEQHLGDLSVAEGRICLPLLDKFVT